MHSETDFDVASYTSASQNYGEAHSEGSGLQTNAERHIVGERGRCFAAHFRMHAHRCGCKAVARSGCATSMWIFTVYS